MENTVHLVDAGEGASSLLGCAVAALAAGGGARIAVVGTTAGRAMLAAGGLHSDAWASPPCGMLRFAHRAVRRALESACGGESAGEVVCWSAVPARSQELAECARRASRGTHVHEGHLQAACDALRSVQGLGRGGDRPARVEMRGSLGATEASLVVLGAADAPLQCDAQRMLDVAGRAMLAGADVHLLLPACAPGCARTIRFARGLGLCARVHVIEGAQWPQPWWDAADAALVTGPSPLVAAAAELCRLPAVAAPGGAGDASCTERRAAGAAERDGAATELLRLARERQGPAQGAVTCAHQPAMNESAASA